MWRELAFCSKRRASAHAYHGGNVARRQSIVERALAAATRSVCGGQEGESCLGCSGRRFDKTRSHCSFKMPIASRPMTTTIRDAVGATRDTAAHAIAALNRRLAGPQPLVLVLMSVASTYALLRLRALYYRSERPLWARIKRVAFSLLRRLPAVQRRIERELATTARSIEASIHGCDRRRDFLDELPADGWTSAAIVERASAYAAMNEHFDYARGRVSGTVYTDVDANEHLAVLTKVGGGGNKRAVDRRCRFSANTPIQILSTRTFFRARAKWKLKSSGWSRPSSTVATMRAER